MFGGMNEGTAGIYAFILTYQAYLTRICSPNYHDYNGDYHYSNLVNFAHHFGYSGGQCGIYADNDCMDNENEKGGSRY